MATVVAGSFVLLGSAEDNILWAIQIGFAASMVLGLVQMLAADHEGPIDRRDWWGLAAGLAGLMTSSQAPWFVLATGIVCLIRGRWKAAAFHTVPLGIIYLVWFVGTGVEVVVNESGESFGIGEYVSWMWDAFVGLFTGLGHLDILAIALVAVLVAGSIVAVRAEGLVPLLRRAAIPAALLPAMVLAMSAVGPSRFALVDGGAKASRYVGLMAAMALPALAVAADALAKRRPWTTPLVIAVFLVALPFNVIMFGDNPVLTPGNFDGMRTYVATLPDNPLVERVPPWVRPNETLLGQPDMTVGWLLEADRRGELPEITETMHPLVAQLVPIQLGVATIDGGTPDGLECADHSTPLAVDPAVGERWFFETPVQIALRSGDGAGTLWLPFEPTEVEITLPDLHLLIGPVNDATTFRLCR
jgi:hypothetical protein